MESNCQALRTHLGPKILGPDLLEVFSGLHGFEAAHLRNCSGKPPHRKIPREPPCKIGSDSDPISNISIRFRSDLDLPPKIRSDFDPISIPPRQFRSLPLPISVRLRSGFDPPQNYDPISNLHPKVPREGGGKGGFAWGFGLVFFASVSRNLRDSGTTRTGE